MIKHKCVPGVLKIILRMKGTKKTRTVKVAGKQFVLSQPKDEVLNGSPFKAEELFI